MQYLNKFKYKVRKKLKWSIPFFSAFYFPVTEIGTHQCWIGLEAIKQQVKVPTPISKLCFH